MTVWHKFIKGTPRTKKNHQQIFYKNVNGKKVPFVMPSKQYKDYERGCAYQLHRLDKPIDFPVNVECVYYFHGKPHIDLVNLEEATLDILVKGGILKDDNTKIVRTMDGSRVIVGSDCEGVEIIISEV